MRTKISLFLCVLPIISFSSYSLNDTSKNTGASINHYSYTIHDIRKGERVFHGFYNADNALNCASCHNVGQIDTFNHYPSAMELAIKYSHKSYAEFKNAITHPTGKVMSQIHDKLPLNDIEIHQLKLYLNDLATKGEEPPKQVVTNRLIFCLLIILFILAFIDFLLLHKVKFKLIHIIVMSMTAAFTIKYIAHSAIDLGRSQNYQPDQPIKFSHKIHAGQNQISCLYCHFNAERSRHAGIPPANVCNNCHVLVKEGQRSGKFEIDKIYQALENNRPIKWIKVHNVPDYVYFNHAQHVVVGKINCVTCHGDVANMDQIVQVKDLSMGWCVNCHRQTNVQISNNFYKSYKEIHSQFLQDTTKKVKVEEVGGTDCTKCHY